MTPSSIKKVEIDREQRHVSRVYARLEQIRAEAQAMQAAGHELGWAGTPEALYERDVMVHHATRLLRTLDAEYEGLVFGRIDRADGEVLHIGRLGVRDPDYEPLVVDWRAPAAAAFYQATAEEPMDVIRRRVIRCSGQRVVDIDDDLLMPEAAPKDMNVVGDGALMAALAQARGTAMRDIVSTIQREQDEAIRAPLPGVTEITGGPGTGKTAVALHRAAYLMYRHRRQMSRGGVLVIGPSPVFMNYISRVLPALGEDAVRLRSLGEVLDGVSATRFDPPEQAQVKGALRMRKVLGKAVRDVPPGVPTELRLFYRGEVLKLDAAALDAARRAAWTRRAPYNSARGHAADALLEALWQQAVTYADEQFRPDRELLWAELRDRGDFVEFLERWWPALTPQDVLGRLGDPERLARAGKGVLTEAEVEMLAASWSDPDAGWSVADVALLDELRVMLGPVPRSPQETGGAREEGYEDGDWYVEDPDPEHYDRYAHIIVDEAQDLSPMQWRMVGRRGQYASWTIVGDPVQSSWPDPQEAAAAREAALGRAKVRRHFTLRTNYRNSAEIFDLAASVVRGTVGDEQLPTAVRTTGVEPQVLDVEPTEVAEVTHRAARELLDTVEGTVGVITTMAGRQRLRDRLADLFETAEDRLQVVGSLEAKGMEYDGVVLVEPDELLTESTTGVRALYVALTRATQRLTVVASGRTWLGSRAG